MSKYRIYFQQVVSTTKTVEADSPEEAIDKAFEEGFTGLMFLDHSYPDEGEWGLASELFPESRRPEDDWEVVE